MQQYTTTFGPDDFKTWWEAGSRPTDAIIDDDREKMLEAMLYIAEDEGLPMIQTINEVRELIDIWVNWWNEKAERITS